MLSPTNFFFTRLLIGFCMMAKREALEDVGGWDEALPGGDDFDLSIRLRQAQWDLAVNRCAYVHHIGQVTGKKVHGDYWDSGTHQERTNNALIRKHGVRAWYDLLWGQSLVRADIFSKGKPTLYSSELEWAERFFNKEEKGLSLGCGENQDGTSYGLDLARPGEHGHGGRKFSGASPDTVGNAEDLPFAEESLDYILASHLLEHLLDPIYAIHEWGRTLKVGGKLILLLPDHSRCESMLIDSSHLHAYTLSSIASLFDLMDGWQLVAHEEFIWASFGIVVQKTGEAS